MKNALLLLLIPCCCFAQKKYDYRNLVLEGGGIRGFAYAGVFNVLENKGILQQVENVGGSSAGAIAGMLVCIGYSASEVDSLMTHLPVQKLNDGKGGIAGKYIRFKKSYGIYKGDAFEKWLKHLVAYKTGNALLTFEDLHRLHADNKLYKDFYCTGTNLSRQRLEVFSWQNTPNMPIALAARISGGIPLYFEPVALDNDLKKIRKNDSTSFINYYVDGGMLNNYPIGMFDSCDCGTHNPLFCDKAKFNTQTLGIKLERQQQIDSLEHNNTQIPEYDIRSSSEYLLAFTNLLLETISRKYPDLENEKGRTIYVSQGNISSQIKKTSEGDKLLLYHYGVTAANSFFAAKDREEKSRTEEAKVSP
jgi:NTE family protein